MFDFHKPYLKLSCSNTLTLTSHFIFSNKVLKIYLTVSTPGVIGSWSNEGCNVSKTQAYKGFVTCECDHLTNFALLLDVSQKREQSKTLSIITWIGCGVSILGLALTIITYLCLE